MLIGLLGLITAGLWIFGFIALARILMRALVGHDPADPNKSDLWAVVGACFGLGVIMLGILAIFGFFSAGGHSEPTNVVPASKAK